MFYLVLSVTAVSRVNLGVCATSDTLGTFGVLWCWNSHPPPHEYLTKIYKIHISDDKEKV